MAGESPAAVISNAAGTNLASVNAAGRLLVDAQISSAGAGAISAYLLNGGSPEQAVDGSGGALVFEWANTTAALIEGIALSVIVEDGSLKFGEYYMGEVTLTNGLLIQVKSQDVLYQVALVKRTREFLQISPPGGFEAIVASPNVVRAWLNLSGILFMPTGTYGSDDYVRVTVQDDLSKMNHQSSLFLAKEVG